MKKLFKNGIVAVACAAALLAGYGSVNAESYSFVDLGNLSRALYGTNYTLSQPENKAYGINDSGQVVGILKGKFGTQSQTHIIRWDNVGGQVTTTDLGMQPLYSTTGVPANGASTKSLGYAINGSGQIVGYTQPTGQSAYYAFLYNPATNTSTNLNGAYNLGLPQSPYASLQATAKAINNSGTVVGFTDTNNAGASGIHAAFIYKNGTMSYIPGTTVGTVVNQAITGSSAASAISNTGLVTGYSTDNTIKKAFFYDSSKSDPATYINNSLNALTSWGNGINDNGRIVGAYTLSGGAQDAFLYENGSMKDLGSLAGTGTSEALAINNSGVIVGTSKGHAFVYENNQMFDLNTLLGSGAETGFTLTTATGINNLGQIIGYGTNAVGEERAFALTVTPTPIPPAVFLFGSGLSGMFFLRRRQKLQ